MWIGKRSRPVNMMNVLLNLVRKTRMILNWVLFSCHIVGHLLLFLILYLFGSVQYFCWMFEPLLSLGSIVLVDLFG